MTVVGIIVILFVAFLTGDKNKIYQGTYCALLGIAISNFSLIALIASVTLIGWLDYRGKSLE
ncbi:hypothetical protein OpiT1DRAFT_05595 [Opitutaceae bacterium TAV1]|nr:hypothetical protein OpiT1DRAFT_05595 [Opitutaceae bacterium TAV1]